MKHNIKNKKLNKTSSHRKAMFMNMSNALIKHEQITTTLAKAKELRRFVEKIVTLGKKGDLVSRRKTISTLQDNKMTQKVFDIFAKKITPQKTPFLGGGNGPQKGHNFGFVSS